MLTRPFLFADSSSNEVFLVTPGIDMAAKRKRKEEKAKIKKMLYTYLNLPEPEVIKPLLVSLMFIFF